MKLIDRGVNGRDKETHGERPAEGQLILPKRPGKKGGEDRVLGEVAAFTDNKLDRPDACVRNIRSKPAEERSDEPRRVLRRKQVGGSDENENHPRQGRQPIFDQGPDIHWVVEACGTEVSLQSASTREL